MASESVIYSRNTLGGVCTELWIQLLGLCPLASEKFFIIFYFACKIWHILCYLVDRGVSQNNNGGNTLYDSIDELIDGESIAQAIINIANERILSEYFDVSFGCNMPLLCFLPANIVVCGDENLILFPDES